MPIVKGLSKYRELFVSRTDAYAEARVENGEVSYVRRSDELTDEALIRHIQGKTSVGCYLVLPGESLARCAVLDIDDDDEGMVRRLVYRAKDIVPPSCLVIEKTGGRGWHIWILMDGWIEAARVRALARKIVGGYAGVEVFPKSDIVPAGAFGTLVRLPLGKHPRSGEKGALFGADMKPLAVRSVVPLPKEAIPTVKAARQAESRGGFPCIAKLHDGLAKGQRDNGIFALACYYRDRGLLPEAIRAILHSVNDRSAPPLAEAEIETKLQSALTGKAKIGCSTPILQLLCDRVRCPLEGRLGEREAAPEAVVATRRTWDITTLMEATLPPIRWVVEGMLPQGFGVLAGKPKIGKSWLSLALALEVARGGMFLDCRCAPGPALFFALEDGESRLQERLLALDPPTGLPVQFEFAFPRFGKGGITLLEDLIGEGHSTGPFALVVIDSLAAAKSTGKEELSPEDMEEIVRPLQQLGHRTGCLVLAIHHHRKAATGDVIWDSRGSGAIVGIADVVMGMYEDDDGDYQLQTKSRDAADLSISMVFNGRRWRVTEARTETVQDNRQEDSDVQFEF